MNLIVYGGRIAAVAGATRVYLAPHAEALEPGDPTLRFIVFMCLYARDVICGKLPGPYTNETAELSARCALIPADELATLGHLTDQELARHFRVPIGEIAAKRRDP